MLSIKVYNSKDAKIWNEFIACSKNGTFIINRSYMDYHKDRFEDFSLLFYKDGTLLAVMPANIYGNAIYSHQGLTYGGVISSPSLKTEHMLELFDSLLLFLKREKLSKLIYKTIPFIYHKQPSDEDLYALFRNNARLYRRDVCTTIFLDNNEKFERRRKRGVKKAETNNIQIKKDSNYKEFFEIVKKVLGDKYNASPVHNAEEMVLLASSFPKNIHLYTCYKGEKMISGAIIYETDTLAHAQYVFGLPEGKESGANDFMYDFLINKEFKHKKYFDFGISNESDGKILNSGLISQKESFGGRAVCHDFYEINI